MMSRNRGPANGSDTLTIHNEEMAKESTKRGKA